MVNPLAKPHDRTADESLSEVLRADFGLIAVLALVALSLLGMATEVAHAGVPSTAELQPGAGPIQVWARAGHTLVIPVAPTEAQLREGMITARLSDNTAVFAPIRWIGPRPASSTEPRRINASETAGAKLLSQRASSWMESPSDWVSLTPATAQSIEASSVSGSWYVLVDLPPDAEGKQLLLDGAPISTGWIKQAPFSAPARYAATAGPWIESCLSAARRSPFTRWRARLSASEPLVALGPARDEFTDNAVESLAEQIEAEWAAGLDRLAAADPAVATELIRRLTLRLDFGGFIVPAWPSADATLDRLLDDLLGVSTTAARRTQRAREWLMGQPGFAAWISNDSALVDFQSGKSAAAVSGVILDSSGGAAAMMIGRPGTQRPEEIARLVPGIVGRASIAMNSPQTGDAMLTIGIGSWSAQRAVLASAVPARPPGLLLGTFFEDWTISSWLGSSTDVASARTGSSPSGRGVPDPDRTSAVLLAVEPAGAGLSGDRRWQLHIECRGDAAAGESKSEVLITLSGAGGDTTLRLYPDGQVVTSKGETSRGTVERTGDRWRAWVTLPSAVMAGSQFLRVGIARIDADGRRTAWPRPMFPWDDLPAQAAIDLSAWDGIVTQTP